jgi:hypothetical protein
MKLNHNRLKNTAIIFELLNQKLTSEIISEKKPLAVNLIKKYFHNTELAKEYALYESIINANNLDDNSANLTLDEVKLYCSKINKKDLNKNKYNLINEINKIYDSNDFFKARVSNYPLYASIYNLLESFDSSKFYDINQVVSNKKNILEHITSPPKIDETSEILKEYSALDRVEKNIVFNRVVDGFNKKYSNSLNNNQKDILLESIFNVSSSPKFTQSVNKRLVKLKEVFTKMLQNVDDEVTQVKLTELIKEIKVFPANYSIKDSDMTKILNYYELEEELNNVI